MKRAKVTPAQIRAVMAELGRRNAGRPKRLTPAGHGQRIAAARQSAAARQARRSRPAPALPPSSPPRAEGKGKGRASPIQPNGEKQNPL